MSCNTKAITNDKAAIQNYDIKRGLAWVFGFHFWANKSGTEELDVSDIEFDMVVYRGTNEAMTILNAGWSRPSDNHIQKSYDEFTEIVAGNYTYELIGTNPDDQKILYSKGDITVK